MNHFKPTNEELQINWNKFLTAASEKPWVITLSDWRALLTRNITGVSDLLTRVNDLFKTKPAIGLTPEGDIIIWTNASFNADAINLNWTWITGWHMGTITNTDVKVVAVDINKQTVIEREVGILRELMSLTTDDLKNVPVIEYWHDDAKITKGGYTLCDRKINVTPVPNGGKWITNFHFSQGKEGQGTNAVTAICNLGLEHSGQWSIKEGTVIYDAITAVTSEDDTSPTTPI